MLPIIQNRGKENIKKTWESVGESTKERYTGEATACVGGNGNDEGCCQEGGAESLSPSSDNLKRRCDYPRPIDIRSSQQPHDATRRQRGLSRTFPSRIGNVIRIEFYFCRFNLLLSRFLFHFVLFLLHYVIDNLILERKIQPRRKYYIYV